MRRWFFLLMCLAGAHLFALTPPSPIQATPSLTFGKQFSTTAGGTTYLFVIPGWGMKEVSAQKNQGYFTLFPKEGGFGCSMQVNRHADLLTAEQEVMRLKETFEDTTDLSDGFEASFKKGRYACRTNGLFVIQIWYVLPNFSMEANATWEALRNCITVSERDMEAPEEWVAVKEIPWKGFRCNHPEKDSYVMFNSEISDRVKINDNPSIKHLLSLRDIKNSGFFYIQWNQENLDTLAPYERHLAEIKEEILSLEKGQKFDKKIQFNAKDEWALLDGYPYALITLSGDGFLFGFALKANFRGQSIDFNPYIKKISWSVP